MNVECPCLRLRTPVLQEWKLHTETHKQTFHNTDENENCKAAKYGQSNPETQPSANRKPIQKLERIGKTMQHEFKNRVLVSIDTNIYHKAIQKAQLLILYKTCQDFKENRQLKGLDRSFKGLHQTQYWFRITPTYLFKKCTDMCVHTCMSITYRCVCTHACREHIQMCVYTMHVQNVDMCVHACMSRTYR